MFFAMLFAQRVRAVEIIFPGSQPKVSSGAGQTTSRGPSAIFYNPANVIMTKFIEPSLDAAFASVSYTYQHANTEDFPDPAVVKLTTPLVTIGAAFRPIKQLTLGFAYLPTGMGKPQLVLNVPQVVSEDYELVDIETTQTSSKMAGGLAFRPVFPFSIGLGVIRTQELMTLKVYRKSDEEIPTVDALYGGAFMQYIGGIRSEIMDRALVLTASYKTAVTKSYNGDISRIGTDFVPLERIGYAPAVIGLGAETRIGDFGLFGEIVMEQWSAGRTIVRRGLGINEPTETDFKDTTNFAGGIKFWVAPKHMLQLSAGMFGANVGDGVRVTADPENPDSDNFLQLNTQDGATAESIAGVGFGDLEAIPRFVVGGGYRAKLQGSGYLQLGAHYQKGSRKVAEGSEGEGIYDLTVLLGTAGIAFGF